MALKYTGQVDELTIGDKTYARASVYNGDPKKYAGSFDKPIPGMTKELALHLIEHSNLHSFEDTSDGDLLEATTTPEVVAPAFIAEKKG